MKRRHIAILLSSLILAGAACACGSDADGSGRVMEQARRTGRHDAMRVIRAPEGSYERDDAMLYIVARASRLADKGYVRASQCYRITAEQILRDSLIIK